MSDENFKYECNQCGKIFPKYHLLEEHECSDDHDNLKMFYEKDRYIEELEHKLALAKKALEEICGAEVMGLLINGKQVATRVLEQLK